MSAVWALKCIKCGRCIRPVGISAAQAPGTMSTGARGYCGSCYGALRRGGVIRRVQAQRPPVDQPDSPCVLVRIDVTPAVYKTLRKAGVNIGAELARYAELMASQLEAHNA